MSTAPPISYDEVPYPALPKVWSHPDRLATLARLHGLDAPPIGACRVLEIGCADGGNLLPMAVALPDSRFVGVDASTRQVASGQEVVDALGLHNVSLHAQDLRTLGDDLGQFDYVIAHGVYSWVPADVREALLRVCQERLASRGVAFVSYNTYPGWHFRGLVREMLLYHLRDVADAGERIARAGPFVDFLVDSAAALRSRLSDARVVEIGGAILQGEQELLRAQPDSYLAHDLLEEVNAPVYFHEFVAHAEQHGLQNLADAEFAVMQIDNLPEPIADEVRRVSRSRVEAEQYLDFLYNRTFRRTLLCHAGVDLVPTPTAIVDLAIASRIAPVSPSPDLAPGVEERFRGPSGTVVRMSHPLVKAALLDLHHRWPQALPFREVLRRARVRLGAPSPADTPVADLDDPDVVSLAQQLLRCYSIDLVELHSQPLNFITDVGARPVACPLARYQAQNGSAVTNRRHETIQLEDDLSRVVLSLLDGSRDRAALLEDLHRLVASGDLEVPSVEDPARRLSEAVDEALRLLARSALLVG